MAATSLQERVMIQELAEAGFTDRRIAQQMGRSIHTVRKWRRKGQHQGRAGLISRMGRPARGALSSFSAKTADTLRRWREAHPGWGALTLQAELRRHPAFQGKPIPSEAVITRWLKQEDFSRPYEKHQELPTEPARPAQACHEEWELDARGWERIPEVGVISLLDVNDVFSKAKLISYPCWLGAKRATRHPTTEDYQLVLRLAFSEWGLPDRLAVDHESPFYDSHNKSPFPTRFHLWLVALGVELSFGRMGQATDQAMTERSHQTWQHQVLDGQHFPAQERLRQALQERRTFLNEHLPCRTLGHRPPLLAHPQARRPRRPYRPEWEAEQLDLSRVYAFLSRGRWFRKGSNVGTLSLGGHVYILGSAWREKEVEITFDAHDQKLVFTAPDGMEKRLPPRGLTVQDLMGELGALSALPEFQLALPFTWNEWRQMQSCALLSGTTL